MDFTLSKYGELCKAILKSNYKVLTVKDYLIKEPKKNFIILRHDVDKSPNNALKMAKIEKRYGLRSTFYFRTKTFVPDVVKKIAKLNHEIGYHYEVLDKAKGNYKKAIEIFKNELKELRKFCEIRTICSHGNPLTKWNNLKLWEKYDFEKFGILGEVFLSLDFSKIVYYSDTGRNWSEVGVKESIKDNKKKIQINSTDELIEIIKKGRIKRMMIVTHPKRWSDTTTDWLKELILQSIKNIGKRILSKSGLYESYSYRG